MPFVRYEKDNSEKSCGWYFVKSGGHAAYGSEQCRLNFGKLKNQYLDFGLWLACQLLAGNNICGVAKVRTVECTLKLVNISFYFWLHER